MLKNRTIILIYSLLVSVLITQLSFGSELRKLWVQDLDTQITDGGAAETATSPVSGLTGTRIHGGAIPWDNSYSRTIRPLNITGKSSAPGTIQNFSFGSPSFSDNGYFNHLFLAFIDNTLKWSADNTYDIGASGATRPRNLYLSNQMIIQGIGPHSVGGVDSAVTEGRTQESIFNIGGTLPVGATTTDTRGMNINATIYSRAGYSSEGINVRPTFKLPVTGSPASVEGVHVDLSNSTWNEGGTAAYVYAFRVRGVPLAATVDTAVGLFIESGFGTNATTKYNILSAGQTAINQFDGLLIVNGRSYHQIGGGGPGWVAPYFGLTINPLVTDSTGGAEGAGIVRIFGSVAPPATRIGYGVRISPTIIEAASGEHTFFDGVRIDAPAITDGGGSVQRVTTLRITGTNSAGTTSNYSLWVDDGIVRIDDNVVMGGGAAPTLGTIGGSGPANAAQVGWLRININSTDSFIPYWQ